MNEAWKQNRSGTVETQTLEQPNAAGHAAAAPPLRLLMSRQQSLRAVRAAIKIGEAIAGQRIRERWELDQARSEKLEWVQRTSDVLARLFNSPRVAEWCNDWVGRILPEFSELGAFVEQFEQEMEHRLNRLRKVLKKIEDIPDVTQNVIHGTRTAEEDPAQPVPTAAHDHDNAPEVQMQTMTAPATVSTSAPASGAAAKCLLLCREDNAPAREAVMRFAEQLDLPVAAMVGAAPEELDHARASFAILLTGAKGLDPFELGFCMGRLGNKRLCIVTPADAPAGDTRGLPSILLDNGEGWQLSLARQLRRAGINVDLNRLA
jgi:hypothetical protein